MATLLELAERCEMATGPDRNLDALIYNMAGFGLVLNGEPTDDATPFTASLDAALTLVPEGWDPQICKGPMFCLSANDTRPWGVSLIGNAREIAEEFGPEMAYDSHDANAATASLAICAAALKARAASCDTHPEGGDGEATAPFMGGAVPNDSEADAHD